MSSGPMPLEGTARTSWLEVYCQSKTNEILYLLHRLPKRKNRLFATLLLLVNTLWSQQFHGASPSVRQWKLWFQYGQLCWPISKHNHWSLLWWILDHKFVLAAPKTHCNTLNLLLANYLIRTNWICKVFALFLKQNFEKLMLNALFISWKDLLSLCVYFRK